MTNLHSSERMTLVTEVLRNAPEWVRHDLAARDRAARVRAEDTLAAMIAAALTSGGQP